MNVTSYGLSQHNVQDALSNLFQLVKGEGGVYLPREASAASLQTVIRILTNELAQFSSATRRRTLTKQLSRTGARASALGPNGPRASCLGPESDRDSRLSTGGTVLLLGSGLDYESVCTVEEVLWRVGQTGQDTSGWTAEFNQPEDVKKARVVCLVLSKQVFQDGRILPALHQAHLRGAPIVPVLAAGFQFPTPDDHQTFHDAVLHATGLKLHPGADSGAHVPPDRGEL